MRGAKATVAALGLALVSCSVGEGSGTVSSERLQALACLDGPYNLLPNFFASVPYRQTQTIRVQRSDEMIDNADGVQILINNTPLARTRLNQPLKVALPAAVRPPGVPIVPDADPALVQLALYLHETCHGQNVVLYAVGGTITFQQLFSGDPNEDEADDRLTQATFDVEVADPREQPPEGGEVPPDKRSRLTGNFRFYFERGQPAQPFP